jgi:hypothetical protein
MQQHLLGNSTNSTSLLDISWLKLNHINPLNILPLSIHTQLFHEDQAVDTLPLTSTASNIGNQTLSGQP